MSATLIRSFLVGDELSYARKICEHARVNTERFGKKMAPLDPLELRCLPSVEAWLEGIEPFAPYAISYSDGAFNPPHCDPGVGDKLHWRLVVMLKNCDVGGELVVDERCEELMPGDAWLFRADIIQHEVKAVREGRRLVMTIGKLV